MKKSQPENLACGLADVSGTQSGFTSLGFMIILATLSLLTLMGVPFYNHAHAQAERLTAIQDLERISAKISAFKQAHQEYPHSLAQIGLDYLRDPWGSPYVYVLRKNPEERGQAPESIRFDYNKVPINSDYDLFSRGANGHSRANLEHRLSADDIVRGRNGAFFGLAKKF